MLLPQENVGILNGDDVDLDYEATCSKSSNSDVTNLNNTICFPRVYHNMLTKSQRHLLTYVM